MSVQFLARSLIDGKLYTYEIATIKPCKQKLSGASKKFEVIFVTGCTGTGKSDLGIAIAKKYGGEVISADSMQIYKGMDVKIALIMFFFV